jgi:hypothetical protein
LDAKDWGKYYTLSEQDAVMETSKSETIKRNLLVMSGKLSSTGATKKSGPASFAPQQFGTGSRAKKIGHKKWAEGMGQEIAAVEETTPAAEAAAASPPAVPSETAQREGSGGKGTGEEGIFTEDCLKTKYDASLDVIVRLYNEKLRLERELKGGEGEEIDELIIPTLGAPPGGGDEQVPEVAFEGPISAHLQQDIDRYTLRARTERAKRKAEEAALAELAERERLLKEEKTAKQFPKRNETEEQRQQRRESVRQLIEARKQQRAAEQAAREGTNAAAEAAALKRQEAARREEIARQKQKSYDAAMNPELSLEKKIAQDAEARRKKAELLRETSGPPGYWSLLQKKG